METDQILTLLLAERERLNRAIQALQSPEKRRGRPPKSSSSTAAADPSKKRGAWTAAKRKAQAAKIKAYWAKRRKQTTQRGKA